MRPLAERIREMRINHKLTQQELADKLGVSQQWIQLAETKRCGIKMYLRICKALGEDVTIDDIWEG